MSRSSLAIVSVLALMLLATGCPKPQPPEVQQPNGSATPSVGTTGTAVTTSAGTATTPAGTAAMPASYDPKSDPLVNPASLYEAAPADASQTATDDVLYRNLEGNPASLNPIFSSSLFESDMSDVLFSGLFNADANMNWIVNDDVVEKFEEGPDHKTFTTKMKDRLTWQDGEPFEAADVCFSWDVLLDPKVNVSAQRSGPDEIAKCEVLDRLTVRLTCKQAAPTNKWNIQFPIIPKHLYEKERKAHPDLDNGDYYNKLNRLPVGNGPYKVVEWLSNDRIVVERWDGYFGRKPAFKRMIFRIVPDPNNMLLSFDAGDLDEIRLTSKQFATQALKGGDFDKAGGLKVWKPQWDLTYICWNMDGSNPFFGDVRVRKAMTMSTDIERMRRDLTYSLYDQSKGVFHPDSWMFPKDGIQVLPYDLDGAAKLLDEAGWKVDESHEGWRYKTIDGKPVQFSFTMLIPQASVLGQQMSAVIQEDLKSIGVKMDMQVMEWAAYQQNIRKHQFQASTAAWGTGTDPDTAKNIWMSDQYDKDGNFGRNYGGYKSAEVDALFRQGATEYDQAKRAEIYGRIAQIIYADQPYTFVFNRPILWAVQKRLHGLTYGPRGIFNTDPSVLAWWVHQGEQKVATAKP
jgi:peptide/nickel transport system substrate-binding protein